jgi:hypothetical protein
VERGEDCLLAASFVGLFSDQAAKHAKQHVWQVRLEGTCTVIAQSQQQKSAAQSSSARRLYVCMLN